MTRVTVIPAIEDLADTCREGQDNDTMLTLFAIILTSIATLGRANQLALLLRVKDVAVEAVAATAWRGGR